MNCKFCGFDPDLIILVPARGRFGADIEVFSCRGCAIEAGLYCTRHEKPHIGFVGDNSTACLACVEFDVQASKEDAEQIYRRMFKGLPDTQWASLLEDLEISSAITGDSDPMSLLRFIMTKAHRLRVSAETVVSQVLQEQSVSTLLPSTLFG